MATPNCPSAHATFLTKIHATRTCHVSRVGWPFVCCKQEVSKDKISDAVCWAVSASLVDLVCLKQQEAEELAPEALS